MINFIDFMLPKFNYFRSTLLSNYLIILALISFTLILSEENFLRYIRNFPQLMQTFLRHFSFFVFSRPNRSTHFGPWRPFRFD